MKPQLLYPHANGQIVEIKFSVELDGANLPPLSAFRVLVDGVAVSIAGCETVFNPGTFVFDTLRLTLAEPVIDGQIVGLSYADPTPEDDTAAIQDVGGEDADSFAWDWIPNDTDEISPTVAVTVDDDMLTAGQTTQVTLTFSERPSNFDPASVVVTNGVLTGLARTADLSVFVGTFTPNGDGPCSVEVVAGSYMDATRSPGAGGRVDFDAEISVPGVTATSDDLLLAAGEDATVTFTFSEAPVGFEAGDIHVENGALLGLRATGDPLVYTATLRPAGPGDLLVGFASDLYTDEAGNSGGGCFLRFTTDFTAPRSFVRIEYAGTLLAGQTIPVDLLFGLGSGATFDFTDLVVENGVLTDIQLLAPDHYVGQLYGTADGTVTITIPSGSFFDPAGNPGVGSSASLPADVGIPAVTLSVDDPKLAAGETARVTFTFSEPPSGFVAGDLSLTNGTLSGFAATADARVYTAVFTPAAEGAAGIVVPAGSYADGAGNPGLGVSAALSFDRTAPTLALAISPVAVDSAHAATVTFSFSEPPSGFTAADILATGGNISLLTATADPKVYTATFTPTREGAASVRVAAGVYADAHGNPGGGGDLAFVIAEGERPPPPPPPPPSGPTDGPDVLRLPETGDAVGGGGGDDWIAGSLGDDWIHGNPGADTLSGGAGADTEMGGRDDDWLDGDAGADMVFGDLGDDAVHGGAGDDLVQGGAGADTVSGDDGDDRVHGGKGDDLIAGGAGADWLFGDLGDDSVTGGAGADRFCFPDGAGGQDVVADFSLAEGDVIWIGAGLATGFDALMAHVTASASGDAVIALGAQTITLLGVTPASLSASAFLFA